jgi:hypothetical protein
MTVPSSQLLIPGTAGHPPVSAGQERGTASAPASLKSLAAAIIARDKERDTQLACVSQRWNSRQDGEGCQEDTELARLEALAIVRRLKTYVLPVGRVRAARAVVQRLWPLLQPCQSPKEVLLAVRTVEAELKMLGAYPEPELAATVELINGAFPGALMRDVRTLYGS